MLDTDTTQNNTEWNKEGYLIRFDGDNSYPDCECCGQCCARVSILCVSSEEIELIRAFMDQHNIEPIDYNKQHCCFMNRDGRCNIWEVRPQTCRLYNCHVPRKEILRINPDIVIDENKPLIDMHDAFLRGDTSDPRYRDQSNEPLHISKSNNSINEITHDK